MKITIAEGRGTIDTKHINNVIQGAQEPTSVVLLMEHERLASLYEHNVTMGDQLVATYLTTVSLAVALLVGVRELVPQSDSIILFELAMLTIVIAVGTTIYRRLIERRVRAVEYLRAINRIHRYFVEKDPSIQQYFYWPPCDDCPPLRVRGTMLGGLRDIVAGLNSLFTGFAFVALARTVSPNMPSWMLVVIGIVTGAIVWFAQYIIREKAFNNAEREIDKYVLFRQP